MTPRSFHIEHKRDLRPDALGLDWRCHFYGDGHWCSGPQWHGFMTKAEAEAAGLAWVVSGRMDGRVDEGRKGMAA